MTEITHSTDKSGEARRLTGWTRGPAIVCDGVVVTSISGANQIATAHHGKFKSLKEAEANAALIAQAFTVTNETGLTPRELAERLKVLEEALQAASDHLDYCGYGDTWERECAREEKLEERIRSALSRATPAAVEGKQ